MTRPQLEKRLREWQQRLGLSHWEITIEWADAPLESHNARVAMSPDYDSATVLITPEATDWAPAFADRVLVHELIHCHLRDLEQIVDRLDGKVSHKVLAVLAGAHNHFLEQAVERLALRFVELTENK